MDHPRTIQRLSLLIVAMILPVVDVKAKEWRGIVPLHSTRADVEKILGAPATDPLTASCKCLYQLKDEIVHVFYANGLACSESERRDSRLGGWKVPADTVIGIVVRFRTDQPLSDFKIDESFEKETDDHSPGYIFYTNRQDGVRIEAGRHTVSSVSYFPSAKDSHLRCPDATDPKVYPKTSMVKNPKAKRCNLIEP